jgi:hypothetical protein
MGLSNLCLSEKVQSKVLSIQDLQVNFLWPLEDLDTVGAVQLWSSEQIIVAFVDGNKGITKPTNTRGQHSRGQSRCSHVFILVRRGAGLA